MRPSLTLSDGIGLKNFNTQIIMEKDFKSFNLVGKYSGNDGNAAGERGTVGKYVITGSDGKGLVVEITDPQDNLSVKALMPRVKSGDDDAIRQIAPIIQKYNS